MKKIQESDFPFGEVMESMKGQELEDRIRKAWEWEMPELRPVPYVGDTGIKVKYTYPELTARCPVTGIQDLYTVRIEFVPDKAIPELKSLKQYFMAYRDLPCSHEHIHAKIFKEFKEQVRPKYLNVYLDVAIRGGIHTEVNYDKSFE